MTTIQHKYLQACEKEINEVNIDILLVNINFFYILC